MQKNEMDKAGRFIIKLCIFSIILSLVALLLFGIQNYFDKDDIPMWNEQEITIVVDAGHGGIDGGALSSGGIKESDLNLEVSLIIQEILTANGYKAVLTRQTDESLDDPNDKLPFKTSDLKRRVDVCKNYPNSVFVSIHMNKFAQERYSGLQVFYSSNNNSSEALAKKIQENVRNFLQNGNDRMVKQADDNIYVLNKIDVPAVLIECGFLSNPEECALLCNDKYRKKLSAVISSSIIEFIGGI